jgi:BlaI family transcriptional regulator, penicillinase repressor
MPKTPRISNAEWAVMQVVWQRSPITTNEVVDALEGSTAWKPKTIMTLLKRLVEKGALRAEKQGRMYAYSPLVQEKECTKAESRSFLDRVYGGSLRPMVAGFLEDGDLTDEDVAELRQMLSQRRKKR